MHAVDGEETMKPKMSKKAMLQWSKDRSDVDMTTYNVDLKIEPNFGVPGAIYVSNHYEDEFFLASISVQEIVQFGCRSWIQPAKLNSQTRIFFSNKVTNTSVLVKIDESVSGYAIVESLKAC